MTHAINSSTKLLSIDITKRAYSDDKELKRQRLKKGTKRKKKVGIKEKKRKEKKRKLKRERKKERRK